MYIKESILLLYQVFSSGIDKEYTYTPNKTDDKTIQRFLDRWEKRGIMKESLGIRFLYSYFCDSYNFWTDGGRDLKTVPLNWILGEPQMGRWDRRIEQFKYSYEEGLLKHSNIPTLTDLLSVNNTYSESISEEYERGRFHNLAEGFINCLLETSLYSNKSKWCESCRFADECKKELTIKSPDLALKRKVIKL